MSIKRMQCVSLIASVLSFASFQAKAVVSDSACSKVLDDAKLETALGEQIRRFTWQAASSPETSIDLV